jgi:nucleotide-binding universal stress UspA family protein
MDWVINRALRAPVDVEVVTVEELDWLPLGADESEYRRKYKNVLASAEQRFAHRRGISFLSTMLLAGEPTDEIVDAAVHADWLVVGSTRRSGDTGALHGTLALRVAARTASRLTVVPAGWEPRSGSVVVGIDVDGSSDAALEVAVGEALRMACDLVLVHAWSLPAPFSILDGLLKTTYPTLEALHRRALEQATKQANALAPRLEITSILRFGSPATVLGEVARDQALLVVGRHHYGRLEYRFLGSVGHDVLLAGPAPIMVVPGRESATPQP